MFQITFPTLRAWILRFIAEGLNGLQEKDGKGRKRKLSSSQEENFRQQVEELQQSREGGRIRGQDVQYCSGTNFAFITYLSVADFHGSLPDLNIPNQPLKSKRTLKKIPGKSNRGST
jgi:hypothetical protein